MSLPAVGYLVSIWTRVCILKVTATSTLACYQCDWQVLELRPAPAMRVLRWVGSGYMVPQSEPYAYSTFRFPGGEATGCLDQSEKDGTETHAVLPTIVLYRL